MSRKTWLSATVVTLAVALVAALIATQVAGKFSWGIPEMPKAQGEALEAQSLLPSTAGAVVPAYRERVARAVIREPENTWSNLAFVFVGALVFGHDRRIFSRLFGAALIALGIASGLYHASLLPAWRTVDVAAMGWVSFALCCHAGCALLPRLDRAAPGSRAREWWIGLAGATLAMLAACLRNEVRIAGVKPFDTAYTTIAGIGVVFALAVFGMVHAARVRAGKSLPVMHLAALVSVVAVAAFCQLNDRIGRSLFAPDAMIQAHAVWHVLMAVAAALAYELFTRIEGRQGF